MKREVREYLIDILLKDSPPEVFIGEVSEITQEQWLELRKRLKGTDKIAIIWAGGESIQKPAEDFPRESLIGKKFTAERFDGDIRDIGYTTSMRKLEGVEGTISAHLPSVDFYSVRFDGYATAYNYPAEVVIAQLRRKGENF